MAYGRRRTPFRYSRKAGKYVRRRSSGGGGKGSYSRGSGGFRRGVARLNYHFKRRLATRRAAPLRRTNAFRRTKRSTVSKSLPSPIQRATAAFRSGSIGDLSGVIFATSKSLVGERNAIIGIVNDPPSLANYLVYAQGMGLVTGSNIQECAVRNVRHKMHVQNMSSYPLRLRVTFWRCRKNTPFVSGNATYDTITGMYNNGFGNPFTSPPSGFNPGAYYTPDATPFKNPLWVEYWKCYKMVNTRLASYTAKVFSQSTNMKRAGFVWEWGNANPSTHTAVFNHYGITTCVILVEWIGELGTDGGTTPNNVVMHSPGVVVIKHESHVQLAVANSKQVRYSANSAAVTPPTQFRMGDPNNPITFTGTNSQGQSVIAGMLTSGL